MGNVIAFNDIVSVADDSFSMSNGLTDVFIDYLLLSGSRLAKTESEKRMVVFLAEKQQIKVGMGNVGFDIVEMPWTSDTFETDKTFVLEMIHHARALTSEKRVWEKMGYEPGQKQLKYSLDSFEALIKRMTINDVDEDNYREWISAAEKDDPINLGFPRCTNHDVLLCLFGCKLCNDGR